MTGVFRLSGGGALSIELRKDPSVLTKSSKSDILPRSKSPLPANQGGNPVNKNTFPNPPTLGDLVALFYEEFLALYGDEELASGSAAAAVIELLNASLLSEEAAA